MGKSGKKRDKKRGWNSAHVILAVGLFSWIVGLFALQTFLGIDTDCKPGYSPNETIRLIERTSCALNAGPKGYFFVAFSWGVPLLAALTFLIVAKRK